MPSDEYKSAGGGALRIKGAKVKKNKTKKKEKKTDLEKNLEAGEPLKDAKNEEDEQPEEKIENEAGDDAEPSKGHKTEAERRFEEARRKKLLEKAESARPELLKTHKERVEELNTYLSKLSEHHDMPKIGPG
ncbi:hypothetical protein VSDG_06621 [Cytospora chrysosperma]|uniref:DUF1754-domain-containing protein n=1 Tax=Cytospora chrysosperma TaxID=252740 RepID=A0A423VNW6_CYTCH|nr:hypothetical protein VSDG_06621 [Valsa sordida]